jgi:hypothetical protein
MIRCGWAIEHPQHRLSPTTTTGRKPWRTVPSGMHARRPASRSHTSPTRGAPASSWSNGRLTDWEMPKSTCTSSAASPSGLRRRSPAHRIRREPPVVALEPARRSGSWPSWLTTSDRSIRGTLAAKVERSAANGEMLATLAAIVAARRVRYARSTRSWVACHRSRRARPDRNVYAPSRAEHRHQHVIRPRFGAFDPSW